MPGANLQIRPCPVSRRAEALALLYRRMPETLRPQLVAEVLGEVDQGRIDLAGLWLACRGATLVGVLLTHRLASRSAAIWPPEVVWCWGRRRVATALIHAALEDLRRQGVRIVQALLDESAPPQATADLSRGGLPRITELHYLERPTAEPLPPGFLDAEVARRLRWVHYDMDRDPEFRAVLEATYQGSLDMPELSGRRSLDDILDSQRTVERFDPIRWRLGRLADVPDAAVLVLLAPQLHRDAWEVAYLGATPSARGRGLARAALAHALDLARPHTPSLELAVDARNTPAVRLYHAAGFTLFDRRAVHLTVLD